MPVSRRRSCFGGSIPKIGKHSTSRLDPSGTENPRVECRGHPRVSGGWHRCSTHSLLCPLLQHVVRAIYREPSFATEVTLVTDFGVSGNYSNEQSAVLDTLANLTLPRIPAPQFALIEPDFNACGPKCFGNTPGRLSIFGGIASKYGFASFRHCPHAPGTSWSRL